MTYGLVGSDSTRFSSYAILLSPRLIHSMDFHNQIPAQRTIRRVFDGCFRAAQPINHVTRQRRDIARDGREILSCLGLKGRYMRMEQLSDAGGCFNNGIYIVKDMTTCEGRLRSDVPERISGDSMLTTTRVSRKIHRRPGFPHIYACRSRDRCPEPTW